MTSNENSLPNSNIVLPVPTLPDMPLRSLFVKNTLDAIRFDLEKKDEDYREFCWFAREYPRIFQHHIDHAKHRLVSIHARYRAAHETFKQKKELNDGLLFESNVRNHSTNEIFWDFECFLSAIGSGLDVLARIIGTAYVDQTPPSFSKLCKLQYSDEFVAILRKARDKWVSRLKDYRDCFVHYTTIDTMNVITFRLYPNGWETRCKLPTNPNVRDFNRWKFNRRTELLRYMLSVWRDVNALDRAIASEMARRYKKGEYPKRFTHLFFLGSREDKKKVTVPQPSEEVDLAERRVQN